MGGMASVFTNIINGELPGRFVYQDDKVVAFLSIEPIKMGHTLVVPRDEVDKWTDLPSDTWLHVARVSQLIGQAVCKAWDAPRAGEIIVGFDVPHTHIHVFPAWSKADYDFTQVQQNVPAADMDAAAQKIRDTLADMVINWEDGSAI